MANKVKSELSLDTAKTLANLQKLTDTLNQTASTLNKTSLSFSNIKKAIDNNTSVMNKTANLYKAANKEFKDTGKELKNVTEKTKQTTKEQKNLGKETKSSATTMAAAFGEVGVAVSATLGVLKSITSTIGNLAKKIEEMVKPQAEYIEDLNFLDNAYGKANNSGKQLLDTLNQMVGYDPTTLIKQTAIFRQMGNALDMDAEVADKLAGNLTKLTVDVKSITGQDLQKVASKFQSAMAGNIRAVRAYGVDVTQAALQQEALRLGIDRQISDFSRAEKSILTYIAMERQLSTANGDLSRTVNSVGNQWEIFKNQIAQLGRLIGGFFIPILKAILPVLNGIIMALNTIISLIMSFFGIDAESFSQEFGSVSSGVDDLADSFDDMADSASGAGKAAKEAQKSLRGFDKLNNITTPTSSGGSSGGGGGTSGSIGGIDPKLLSFLDDYNLHLEDMNNWAAKIRDKIMSWLGFTKIVNEETGKVTYKFQGIGKVIENIRRLAKDIFNSPFGELYTTLVGMGGPLNFIYVHLGKILATNDEVWEGFKTAIQTAFETVQPLFDFFTNTVIPGIGAAFEWLHNNVIKPFSDFIDSVFTSVWEDTLLPIIDRFNKELLPVLIETFEELWNDVIKPGADLLAQVLTPIIETVIGVLDILWKNVLSPLINFVLNNVFDTLKTGVEIIKTVVIPVIKNFITSLTWLWQNVLGPVVNFVKDVVLNVINVVTSKVKSRFEAIRNVFTNLIEFVKDVFTGNWSGALSRVKDIFINMFKPIIDTIDSVKKALGNIGTSASNLWNGTLGKLFGGGKAEGGIWNNGIWSPIKAYAGGGFPSRGEIFMARETRGPELVGRIGSSTAVLNNDQILEQMTIAVARGMAASGNQEKQVNIIAEADTEGLLNFISFKNASKNRQYGL